MKHKKWVSFYIFVILFLMIFALFLSDVINFQVPFIKITRPSPDRTSTKLIALCNFEKYDSIALDSLKYDGRVYSRITKEDILESDLKGMMGYPASAKSLCNIIASGRKVEKIKLSEGEWEYKYYSSILVNTNHAYSIVFIDRDWRYVLPKWLSL